MTTTPENSQPSESKSLATSPNSATSSATPSFHNPFQGPDAQDAWRRLRAERGPIVSRDEMMRHIQEQAQHKASE